MAIVLASARRDQCPLIHDLQVRSFAELLERYQDYSTNPGAEVLEIIYRKFDQLTTHYFLIEKDGEAVGAIRIIDLGEQRLRVSPIFVLPEFRRQGIAQKSFEILEAMFPATSVWELDTILEEESNCRLYERVGYRKTGELKKLKEGMTLVSYEKCTRN